MRRALLGVALVVAGCGHTPPPGAIGGARTTTTHDFGGAGEGSVRGSTEPAPVTPDTSLPPTTAATIPEGAGSPPATASAPSGALTTVSWYGAESGGTTASGEAFDPDGLTFAHRTLPFGTVVEFCRGSACVVAHCTDRGPFVAGRDFDLSRGAFAAIAPLGAGVVDVTWRRVA